MDKHSSGGISDTTSLALVPLLASCGLKCAKMSGRGLGFTGGTLDKLEAINNFKCELTQQEFINDVNTCGACIMSQTKNIVPADKILYALRDQTATVESIPLIASSIMSKKLASGAKIILLDVKYGSGAFMKTKKDAIKLAKTMVEIGKRAERTVCAIITNMDIPLGNSIGCALEVMDAIDVLNGEQNNLSYLVKLFASKLIEIASNKSINECKKIVEETISSKKALSKFAQMVKIQGGDEQQILENKFEIAPIKTQLIAKESGYIQNIDALKLSKIVSNLGGERMQLNEKIDHSVGVRIAKHYGSKVEKGEVIAEMYSNLDEQANKNFSILESAFTVGKKKPKKLNLVAKIIE